MGRGRRFDRILFLLSFGYAADPVRALWAARDMLTDDGFILLTRTQPIRYALQRTQENGTSVGEEAVEPHMSAEDAARYPEEFARISQDFIGIITFKLRALDRREWGT